MGLIAGYTLIDNSISLCQFLNIHEKGIINIIKMKSFQRNYATASIREIARALKIAKSTVQKYVKTLIEKKILIKERMYGYRNMNLSNQYTFCEHFAEILRCSTIEEAHARMDALREEDECGKQQEEIRKQQKFQDAMQLLKDNGYDDICKQLQGEDVDVKINAETDVEVNVGAGQADVGADVDVNAELERTIESIKQNIEYDSMKESLDNESVSLLDASIRVVRDTLASSLEEVNIRKQNVKKSEIIQRFLELKKEDVLYAISQFRSQNTKIYNVEKYLLVLLYSAGEQRALSNINSNAQRDYVKAKNAFHNFDQRDYDYDALLHKLNGIE